MTDEQRYNLLSEAADQRTDQMDFYITILWFLLAIFCCSFMTYLFMVTILCGRKKVSD